LWDFRKENKCSGDESHQFASVVAPGYVLDDRGFESRQGLENFLFTTAPKPALGLTQPPVQWVTVSLSLEVKRLGREADHSPPTSAEMKNAWRYVYTPHYVFLEWCRFKFSCAIF
jgi:hypothetical protein